MPRPTKKLKAPAPPIKLDRGEHLRSVARRHWVALARRAAFPLAIWAILALLFLLRLPQGAFARADLVLFFSGAVFFLILLYIYFDWRNDVLYVTSKRVIYVDRVLFISSRRNELLVDSIENVIIETNSIIARQLNYGDIVVQTASRMRNIRFRMTSNPEATQRGIMTEVRPVQSGMAEERVRQVVRARVLEGQTEAPPPAPVHLLPRSFFGSGFTFFFPPNPRQDGDSIMWHKHWIVAATMLLDPLLLLAILTVSRSVLTSTGILAGSTASLLFALAAVSTIAWMIYRWLDWTDDVYILSPTDVVDIERHPLGKEERRQASLAAIVNVTSNQPNLLARMLNYGDVFLQTAGGEGEFSFYHVPAPDRVQAVVFDYLDGFKRRQQEKDRYAVLDLIRQYHLMDGSAIARKEPTGEQEQSS